MNKVAIFDAKSWIRRNCPDGDALKRDTVNVVSNFTLIWNLFENTLCNNEATVGTFDDIAKVIALRGLPDDVQVGVRFWADRYWIGSKFNDLFEDLNFRKGNKRDHVEAVLSGLRNDFIAKFWR